MIKANTTVIVGSKIYKKGQTIKGLSKSDKEWMQKAGYIAESVDEARKADTKKAEKEKTDGI